MDVLTPAGRPPFMDRELWPDIGKLIRQSYLFDSGTVVKMQEVANAVEVLVREKQNERSLVAIPFRVEALMDDNGSLTLNFYHPDGSPLDLREFDPDPTERHYLRLLRAQNRTG